jgi:hypothetical protein
MVWPALAGPPLTTIQDTLYKADGSRFTGNAVISWNAFEGPDLSNISPQSVNVNIVDGGLKVQLVPTTSASPAAYYTVKYYADGRVQFQETWSVPGSNRALRVRDVRIATPAPGGQIGNETGVTLPIQETDVSGLVADLGVRPVKGAGYAPGRVVAAGSDGTLNSVAGNAADCVRVDGTSGPCGSPQPGFVDGETPAGAVDGANTTFSLAGAPAPLGSLTVYRNGILLGQGLDYTATGSTIQFVTVATPQPGDVVTASYRLAGEQASASQMYPTPQVLCSGTGAATNAVTATSIGICTIPANTLAPGERVQVLMDFAHAGGSVGYSVEVHWGGTTVLARTAPASEPLLSGRVEAAVFTGGAQVSAQSWGTTLGTATGLTSASDALDQALAIRFYGSLSAASGDTVTLRSFTVLRLP